MAIKRKLKKVIKPTVEEKVSIHDKLHSIESRKDDTSEVLWSDKVCMNPTRFMNFDCEGCNFLEPCKCIGKLDYAYAKRRKKKEEEVKGNMEEFVETLPTLQEEPISTPVAVKPKKKVVKAKKTAKVMLNDYVFDL